MPYVSAGGHVPSVTADQMRAIDRIAVEDTGPTLLQMMDHAGRSLAGAVLSLHQGTDPVVVLAGHGGNGGGGIAAARHMRNRGVPVVVAVAEEHRIGHAYGQHFDQYLEAGGDVVEAPEIQDLSPGLVVDAVLGYGLDRAPRGVAAGMIRWTNAQGAPVVALDVPSGLDATTGRTPGVHVVADQTVTLALPKAGLRPAQCGRVLLADLGIPTVAVRRAGVDLQASPFGAGFVVELHWRDPDEATG